MVGSDLEENGRAGSTDLVELIDGYDALPDSQAVEVIVAFGGARTDGWRGMKFASISQLTTDAQDMEFGNETGPNAYLYQADGAHMGDESSLKLFLDYLRDGYYKLRPEVPHFLGPRKLLHRIRQRHQLQWGRIALGRDREGVPA